MSQTPFYDYSCPACGIFEMKGRFDDDEAECACGKRAPRVSVYQVSVSGFARPNRDQREVKIGAFQEAGAELEYKHSRQTKVDGSESAPPPLWQMAKANASRLQKLGVKDSLDVRT